MSDAPKAVTHVILNHLRDLGGGWRTPEQVAEVLRSSNEVPAEHAERAHERSEEAEPSDAQAKRRDGFQYLAWETLSDLADDAGTAVEMRLDERNNTAEFRVDPLAEEEPETVPNGDVEVVSEDKPEVDLPALFERQDAPLPDIYERTRRALQECERVVKAKEYERSARALETFARMKEDEELIKIARRIRLYAARKVGELLEDHKQDPEKNLPSHRSKGDPTSVDGRPTSQREAAEQAGLSKHQEAQARQIANVQEGEFETAVESDDPPSVTEMASRGMESSSQSTDDEQDQASQPDPPQEPDYRERAAVWLDEALDRFEWWCQVQDPGEVRGTITDAAVEKIEQKMEEVTTWFGRFRNLGRDVSDTGSDGTTSSIKGNSKEEHGGCQGPQNSNPHAGGGREAPGNKEKPSGNDTGTGDENVAPRAGDTDPIGGCGCFGSTLSEGGDQ